MLGVVIIKSLKIRNFYFHADADSAEEKFQEPTKGIIQKLYACSITSLLFTAFALYVGVGM